MFFPALFLTKEALPSNDLEEVVCFIGYIVSYRGGNYLQDE